MVLAARNFEKLQELAAVCQHVGSPNTYAVQYDACDPLQSNELVAKAAGALGGLDIVVLDHVAPPNSGDYTNGAAVKVLQDAAEVDFYSYVALAQHALAIFQQQHEVMDLAWCCISNQIRMSLRWLAG